MYNPELDDITDDHGNLRAKQSSKRAFIKDLKEVIEQSDVILEVLDARDPLNCRNIEMEHQILSKNKKLVFVLNKIDLVSPENARGWLAKLRDESPTVLFKASTMTQKDNLASRVSLHKESLLERSDMVDQML